MRCRAAGVVARDFDHRAGLGGETPLRDLLEDQVQAGGRGAAGQEAQMPGVDAHDGIGAPQRRCTPCCRAVAAVADHHRIGRLFARALSVDLFRRNADARKLFGQRRELLVDGVVEPEMRKASNSSDLPGGVRQLAAGKYDFHRRSFEKISNFTTPRRYRKPVRASSGSPGATWFNIGDGAVRIPASSGAAADGSRMQI